jgi:hypothetical protein
LQRLIGDVIGSYVQKAKVNKQGSTKKIPVTAPSVGSRNPLSDPQLDQIRLEDKMWENRKMFYESDADFQRRLQNKIAQLTAEHRKLGK